MTSKPKPVGWQILLVDDDEDDYIITKSMLNRPDGRKVTLDWAPSYENGQQKIHSKSYDAVLVDYDLGTHTGIEFIRETIGKGYPFPLILYTGRGSSDVDMESMQAGATLYLTKTEVNPLLLERSLRYAIERKHVEEQLAYQAKLLSNVHDPVFGTDAGMRITYWNQAAEDTFGWTEAEVLGRDVDEVFAIKFPGSSTDEVVSHLIDVGHFEGEGLFRTKDSRYITAHARSSVIRGPQGDVIGQVTSLRDITARRTTEDALAAAVDRQARELDIMSRLRTISLHIVYPGDLSAVQDEIVETALVITQADMANLQLYDPTSSRLKVAASRGYDQAFLEYVDSSANNRSVHQHERLSVEDVRHSPVFAGTPELLAMQAAGVQAVQSTPLQNHAGKLIGRLTTHDRSPRRLDERDMSLLDLLAQQAADGIERIQAQQALHESEERFRLASKATPGVLYDITVDRTVVYQSEGLEQVVGYRPGEEPGGSSTWWPEHIHPDDYPAVEAEFQAAINGQKDSICYEYRLRHADGHWVYILDQCHIVRDQNGKATRIVGIATDITERKLAEKALSQSEERLKRSQEIAHLGSWELDLVNDQLSWSDEVYRIFGLRPQGFGATYEAFLEAVHPDDRTAVDEAYSGSIRDGRDTYEIDHRVIRKSTGEVRTVHEKCEHIRDASGRIIRSIGMVHDVTDQKRVEEALRELSKTLEERVAERTRELRESEERFRALIDATAQMVWTTNAEGNVVEDSPSWRAFTGQTYEEWRGTGWLDAIHPDDRDYAAANWRKSIETLTPVNTEFRVRHVSGEWRLTHVRAVPLFHPDGSVRGWVGMNTDLTEQMGNGQQTLREHGRKS